MKIPTDNPPGYTAEELEIAQDSEVRRFLERFIKHNHKTFSIGEMAHVLGVSPQVILEIVPWLKKGTKYHNTQMVVVVKDPSTIAEDSARFQAGDI